MRKPMCAALLLTLWAAGVCGAQEYRGRVQGVVSDQGGGVVPGAMVMLKFWYRYGRFSA